MYDLDKQVQIQNLSASLKPHKGRMLILSAGITEGVSDTQRKAPRASAVTRGRSTRATTAIPQSNTNGCYDDIEFVAIIRFVRGIRPARTTAIQALWIALRHPRSPRTWNSRIWFGSLTVNQLGAFS